jgi:hypothetical protein
MPMQPNYPLYIVSKGRADSRLTMKALDRMGVRYFVVVESQEADEYRAALDSAFATVLILDPAYQRDYDTCDDLGDTKSKGPGPARNFVWNHAIASGATSHWVIDDNISHFHRLHQNRKVRVHDGVFFGAMEVFVDRYENIAMAGPNYKGFADPRSVMPPFITNTRVYSCNLIRNDVPFRWRGRYNEDTILAIDMLKAGWCTVQFNAFLQDKLRTQTVRGGNTDEFYIREGTLAKSRMQVAVHPDVSRLVWRFNRWHHHVDYRRFKKNKLRLKPGIVIPDDPNEYGMKLVRLDGRPLHETAAD